MYGLSEEQKMIKDLARKIAEDVIKPIREECDKEGRHPHEVIEALTEAGLIGLYVPEDFGGGGLGSFETSLVMEELSRVCAGCALPFGASALGSYPLILFGTKEQNEKYLTKIAGGETLAAFALTEPEAGSDAGAVRTQAKKDGDHYVLNGVKQWITNGSIAKVYTVIAQTDKNKGSRGLSAFVVEEGTPGFSYGNLSDKMGIRASKTSELIFEDCRIPKENLIYKEGLGFVVAMKTLDKARPGVAAQALGIAQGAFEEALNYYKTRIQFGNPLVSNQGISFMLANMATDIESARSLLYNVARYIDTDPKDISKYSAMCKLVCSDLAMKVTTDAVKVFGGYGYMRDYPVEKMMRDAKITQIYEGTNQIQRLVIAGRLVKEGA
jgi:butyryl-CoA dehydrogenase